MSQINWINRGSNDGFDESYGSKATIARQLVDLAINNWSSVIQDFNYSDSTHPNEYQLTIIAENLGSDPRSQGFGGYVNPASIEVDVNGKPFAAIIKMDDDAADSVEGPWFFAHEWINNFSSRENDYYGYSSEIIGIDFYTVIHHELGHALGFSFPFPTALAIGQHLTPVDSDNPNPAIVALQNFVEVSHENSTRATFNGGHLWPGYNPTLPSNLVAYPQPFDLMSGTPLTTSIRQMISPLDAQILRDAYGYTICNLNDIPTLDKPEINCTTQPEPSPQSL